MKRLVSLLVGALMVAGAAAAGENPRVALRTSKGTIVLELYPDKAPRTVENFLRYVREGFYAGTVFHRVIPGFVIQGGGLTADLQPKPTHPPIPNEATNGLSNRRGTVAMARTMVVDSATSQFFVNLK
ncbi:peptidylprolyl isomerase, partial [Deferrisoma sp.]